MLFAAIGVLLFFLLFVLPQFAAVLRDFGAKLDSALSFFIRLSDFLRANGDGAPGCGGGAGRGILARAAPAGRARRDHRPCGAAFRGISAILQFYRTSLFCRNLGVLLGSGVSLTATLRILVDMMAVTGDAAVWTRPPTACAMAASCPKRSPTSSSIAAHGGAHAAAG